VQGDFVDETPEQRLPLLLRAVATGNMNYWPNGCVHSVTTQNGATVLAVVWGRTEPV
jgi:hypothetical protein